jgi:hypothetical protein
MGAKESFATGQLLLSTHEMRSAEPLWGKPLMADGTQIARTPESESAMLLEVFG